MKTKNPFLNAFLAAAYIVLIVFTINALPIDGPAAVEPRFPLVIPMAMLSLFVLSAAVMGFLFVYEPLRLYMEGAKSEALAFFGKTVGTFALFAIIFVALLLL